MTDERAGGEVPAEERFPKSLAYITAGLNEVMESETPIEFELDVSLKRTYGVDSLHVIELIESIEGDLGVTIDETELGELEHVTMRQVLDLFGPDMEAAFPAEDE